MLIEVVAVLVAVFLTCLTVMLYIPWLWVGWLNLFIEEGGNLYLTPVLEGRHSSWLVIRLLIPLFFAVFLLVIPFAAKLEEELFRKGIHDWPIIACLSLIFGFAHCLVGVPIGAGLVLSGVGLFYAWKYRSAYIRFRQIMTAEEAEDEALLVSTTYHSLYNSLAMIVVVVLTTILALTT